MTRPQLSVFCGTNGAGKTTLYRRFFDKEIDYVNPDNIKIGDYKILCVNVDI